jgi:hypothetical protein
MSFHSTDFQAQDSFWQRLFRRRPAAPPDDQKEIKRRALIELAHLPPYLKQDIGLFDD